MVLTHVTSTMYSTHAYNYIVSTNYMYKYVGCIFVLLQCFEMTHEVISHIESKTRGICLPTASVCVSEDRAQIRSIYYIYSVYEMYI